MTEQLKNCTICRNEIVLWSLERSCDRYFIAGETNFKTGDTKEEFQHYDCLLERLSLVAFNDFSKIIKSVLELVEELPNGAEIQRNIEQTIHERALTIQEEIEDN